MAAKRPEDVERKYHEKGLETEHVVDSPGKIYLPHRHEQTFIHVLAGSLRIRVDAQEWLIVESNQEFVIGADQLHEAEVGPMGCEYIAAWNEK